MEKINQRRFHRVRPTGTLGKSGTIFVDLKNPATHCNVIDVSAGGACIEVHGTAAIPKKFILNHGGVKKSCRVVWQKGRRVGVCF
jgi:PilZ domain